jgi:hypothetical protein
MMGNPHFLGRHTPVRHTIKRELMWTSYGAREVMFSIIRAARDGANDMDVPNKKKPLLKASAERVETNLRVFVDKIDENDRNALLEVMWGMRGIGENSGRRTKKQLDQLERARTSDAERDQEAREFGLALLPEAREKHPKRVNHYIAKTVNDAMNEKYPGANFKKTARTVGKWIKDAEGVFRPKITR